MARKMVCEWGMSDSLGPLTYGKKEEAIFLGKEFNRHQDYSEATALKIDAEIKRIVTDQYERAQNAPDRQGADPGARGRGAARARGARRARSCASSSTAQTLEPRKPAERAAPPSAKPRPTRASGRLAGILPPPMAAPKPTA